jgi:hypothetical protein
MRGAHRAKEMERRASQRRASHKARQAALMLRAPRMAAVETRRGKTKVGSKSAAKPSVKASKPKKG